MNPKLDTVTQDDINGCCSVSSLVETLGFSVNSRTFKKIIPYLEAKGLDCSNIKVYLKPRIYPLVEISCPVCGNSFSTRSDHPRSKVTCSYSCSNTYFRSGANNPNYKSVEDHIIDQGPQAYVKICFAYHKKECIVCKESTVVSVHHYDCNHENNDPANLVPLCPTHHVYMHSKHAYLIQSLVDTYVDAFTLSY